MYLHVCSTTVKATVVHVAIVVMLQWNWVLLLLLMVKGFMASVTCVVKLGT